MNEKYLKIIIIVVSLIIFVVGVVFFKNNYALKNNNNSTTQIKENIVEGSNIIELESNPVEEDNDTHYGDEEIGNDNYGTNEVMPSSNINS